MPEVHGKDYRGDKQDSDARRQKWQMREQIVSWVHDKK